MRVHRMFHFTIMGILMVSCGKKSKSDDTAASAGIAELQGTWVTGCVVSAKQSSKTTYVFSAAKATGTTQNFSDTTCTTQSYSGSWSGTVTGGDAASTPADAKKFDFTYATISYIANTAAIATSLNSVKLCEYSDWVVNVAKDGIGKKCGATTDEAINVGTVQYSIYKVVGTKLSVGVEDTTNTGKTDALREKAFEADTYTKQ
ncbi:MAG: hypothetical protein NTZ90_08555 [Proteobacteria bacterium]|nr:hypothetical protein [Pseudomonadota bacterium]